jgi:two-component system, LytTR family, response regulator AlgR
VKILIVDDEGPARERLRRLLQEAGDHYEVVGEAGDGETALEACDNNEDIELVLLDISMPGMDGLETAARLAELAPPPVVILVTAHDAFALDAFERGVQDYLVKPVRRERLQAALERVRLPTRVQQDSLREPSPKRRRHLTAHYRGSLVAVPVEEVLYLQAEHKYVTVRHASGQILLDEPLKALEDEFSDLFMRVHRNALVSRRQVSGLDRAPDGSTLVRLRGCEERLPVSRRHLGEVRRWLRLGMED